MDGRTVVLLCIAADEWSHETVPYPLSRPGKKQLRTAEIDNIAASATRKHNILPEIRQIRT
jgi:hypothetical protein